MNVPRFDQLLDLSGKVALVTGASQGIGAGIASRFAQAGAAIVVHYRGNAEAARAVVNSISSDGGQAVALHGDLTQADDVDALIEATLQAFGALDIAVNNAGSFPNKALLEMTGTEWQAMYADNVETAFLCTQAAAREMKKAGGGAIVNIGSIAATVPGPDHSHYNSAKAAVVMLTRSAAQELGPFGIRVNAVSPGLIARAGIEEAWPEGVARWTERAPLARLGRPEDVADACLFLASPAARWITGHNLLVDGGIMAARIY
jgi:NAD(P)-dependent dehydrogenase (short-subunit alcohol dehydrogenase family)